MLWPFNQKRISFKVDHLKGWFTWMVYIWPLWRSQLQMLQVLSEQMSIEGALFNSETTNIFLFIKCQSFRYYYIYYYGGSAYVRYRSRLLTMAALILWVKVVVNICFVGSDVCHTRTNHTHWADIAAGLTLQTADQPDGKIAIFVRQQHHPWPPSDSVVFLIFASFSHRIIVTWRFSRKKETTRWMIIHRVHEDSSCKNML